MTASGLPDRTGFVGRTAIVTGAASGIGRATAQLLLARGAHVIAVDLQANAALQELARAGAQPLTCDVTRARDRQTLVEQAPACDYLVNSAGVIRLPSLAEADEHDWDVQFAVNAKAVFFLCQQVGSRLRRGGAIVNVSSVAARNAQTTEAGIYAASKAAVLSITRTFAHAYASREVRVNAIVPGLIDTPMQDYVLDQVSTVRKTDRSTLNNQRKAGVPMGRLGTAAECAEAIVWLLSPASSYLTGQALAVDGGATML